MARELGRQSALDQIRDADVAFGAGALSIDNRSAKDSEITANLSLAG
jgi:hypothetical protein